jgi:hypothetical protein
MELDLVSEITNIPIAKLKSLKHWFKKKIRMIEVKL